MITSDEFLHLETRQAPIRLLRDHWTTAGGVRVFSRVSEAAIDAIPIVHLHGFGISGRYLVPTAMRLAAHYPTYVPDLPGHGRSENPPHLLDVPGLAAAVAEYMDAVAVPRAVLLGNSLGCLIAAECAHRFPERVEGVVLVSPAGGAHNRPLPRGASQLLRDSVREPAALARIAVPDYVRYGPRNSLRMFRGLKHYPSEERLSALPVRCLAIVGLRDRLVSATQLTRLFSSAAGHPHVYLVDSAHAINFSHPGVLAHIVHAYLQGHPVDELREDGKVIARLMQRPAEAVR